MSSVPELPLWADAMVALLLLLGAGLTLIGTIGLLRLPNFYQRVHPPTLGMTMGAFFVILASMLCFSVLQSRLVLHELLIGMLLLLTAPVTLVILVQGAWNDDLNNDAPERTDSDQTAAANSGKGPARPD